MQVAENEKLSDLHQRVYNKYQNTLGKRIAQEFFNFLTHYTLQDTDTEREQIAEMEDSAGNENIRYYVRASENLKIEEQKTMYVNFNHLTNFQWEDAQFIDRLQGEYVRFEPYLRQGLTQFLADQGHQITDSKWYQVGIYNMPAVHKIRDLKTLSLGKIMSIQGTVTRTTEVKPELQIGAFRCQMCNQLIQGVEQQYKFTEPIRCDNERCYAKEYEIEHSNSVFKSIERTMQKN